MARREAAPRFRQTALKQLTKRMERLGLTDRVLVHPPMSPEELAAAMRRMEFTCAPLTETLRNVVQGCCPVKIVESMAAGTPVLASNLRVTRALITPGTDGYLACPGDVRDWALAIQRLLSDADLRDRLAAGAKNKASNCFTLENMSDRLNEVILIAGNLHGSSPQRRRVYK
jgi:glycosyltransferase involved in cell wall biosynthesis